MAHQSHPLPNDCHAELIANSDEQACCYLLFQGSHLIFTELTVSKEIALKYAREKAVARKYIRKRAARAQA